MNARSIEFSFFSRRGDLLEIIVFPKEKTRYQCFSSPRNEIKRKENSSKFEVLKKHVKMIEKATKRKPKGGQNKSNINIWAPWECIFEILDRFLKNSYYYEFWTWKFALQEPGPQIPGTRVHSNRPDSPGSLGVALFKYINRYIYIIYIYIYIYIYEIRAKV